MLLLHFSSTAQFNDIIHYSTPGGIYENIPVLTIDQFNQQYSIHYTIDGTLPDSSSTAYLGEQLYLNESFISTANIHGEVMSPSEFQVTPRGKVKKCVVITAASFDSSGNRQSDFVTASYFIKAQGVDHHSLPIISINTNRENLFDYHTGIFVPGIHWTANNPEWTGNYYMNGVAWEREARVEMYESNGQKCFAQACGLRTHGGNSRRFEQKGMKIYARSEYGVSHFNYPIFPQKPITSFKRLALKPFSASWSQAGIENYLANKLSLETSIDVTDMRPTVVYLNGEYWGIYYLTERIDDDYLEENHNIEITDLDIISDWNGLVEEGNNENFLALLQFIESADFTNSSDYQALENWIDIDNFIDYQLLEIFLSNLDWPTNNMKCWRQRHEGEKWRWILFDGDGGMQYHRQLDLSSAVKAFEIEDANEKRARLLLRKVLENEIFFQRFVYRLNQLLTSNLKFENTLPYYNDIIDQLQQEIAEQSDRFLYPISAYVWRLEAQQSKYFLALRHCEIKAQILAEFELELEGIDCDDSATEVRNLEVFPNPSSSSLFFQFNSDKNTFGTISIINIHNQLIYQEEISILKDRNKLDFTEVPISPGPYLVRLQTKNSQLTAKFLIQK